MIDRKQFGVFVIVWCCLLCFLGSTAFAQGVIPSPLQAALPERQALLVLINRLSLDDVATLPHMRAMAQGLLNVNSDGQRTDASAYATLALGVPAQMRAREVRAYNAEERLATQPDLPVAAVYQQLTGTSPEPTSGVLLLSLFHQQRHQNVRQWSDTLGLLGEALHREGKRTAVYGSSDRGMRKWRPAALITTDSRGATDFGDVSDRLLTTAPTRPYGVRTDYAGMLQALHQNQSGERASLLVFDLGDLYRLESYRPQLTPARYEALRAQTLQEIDDFLGHLVQGVDAHHLVVVATPDVSADAAQQHQWLAPVAMAGGLVQSDAVLTSATTRRAGLVTNLDVVPTLADFLQVERPAGMIGFPLRTTTVLPPSALARLSQSTVWTYTHRDLILWSIGAFAGVGFLMALVRLLFSAGPSLRMARRMLWCVLAMPLCLYLSPLWQVQNLLEFGAVLTVNLLLVLVIPFRVLPITQSVVGRAIWLCGWTLGVILFDIWQGGMLAKNSLLSYDPIVGARYYGIGNEYMGVLVGAVTMLYGALLSCRVPYVNMGFVLMGGLLTMFFASPTLGTNTGGALTMAGTTALCLSLQKRWRPRTTCWLTLLAVSLALVGVVALPHRVEIPSHIGAAANRVLAGEWVDVLRILSRKSEMFLRFFTTSSWSFVLMGVYVIFLWFLLRKPLDIPAAPALVGAALGAAVGLFTNDSGGGVAGMMLLFSLFLYLLLSLERMQRELEHMFAPQDS